MPRYFFNVRDGHTSLDHEGMELAGLDQARAEALRTSGEILRDMGPKFWRNTLWTMWVTNSAGETLFTLKFSADDRAAAPMREPAPLQ